jgi:hypothetical protein
MPSSYEPGRIVNYDDSQYFRDVNSFVTQLKDSMEYYTAEVVANNIQNCLKGQAIISKKNGSVRRVWSAPMPGTSGTHQT